MTAKPEKCRKSKNNGQNRISPPKQNVDLHSCFLMGHIRYHSPELSVEVSDNCSFLSLTMNSMDVDSDWIE